VGMEHRRGVALGAGGGLDHDSAGEIFSPTQFGFCLLLPAFLVARRSPSLNDGDVIVNTPCALALSPLHAKTRARPAAIKTIRLHNMRFLRVGHLAHRTECSRPQAQGNDAVSRRRSGRSP